MFEMPKSVEERIDTRPRGVLPKSLVKATGRGRPGEGALEWRQLAQSDQHLVIQRGRQAVFGALPFPCERRARTRLVETGQVIRASGQESSQVADE